ncbi:MAG: hypothetical protein KDD94_08775, partial [Calditrichaeota bacterium]|nr:hypothetical protein [Calditrichota bacterium]
MKFLLFFLIFSFFCKAQFQNVSVFAGVNSTSINLSVDSKVSRGTGILAGIRYFNWDESTWSFTVAFDQKAYSTTTILNKAITLDVTVNYLNLSPQFRLIKDGQFVFFVGAGLGIVLSGTSVLNSNGSSSSYSNKEFWKPVR